MDFDEFISAPELPEVEPERLIVLRTSGGATYNLEADQPTPIRDLLAMTDIAIGQNVEWWVDGQAVTLDTPVAPGATITAVGVVKGG